MEGKVRKRVRWPTMTAIALIAAIPIVVQADVRRLSQPIAPQPLADALDAFMADTGLQLVYPAPFSKGLMSPGAPAGLSIDESLRALLDGTGLIFAYVNDRTVTVLDPATLIHHASRESATVTGGRVKRRNRKQDVASAIRWRELDEVGHVVITGSQLPGEAPVGLLPIVITRAEMEAAGYSVLHDALSRLPQSFNGGGTERTIGSPFGGVESNYNFSLATGFNLRGLGSGSTLVLLNGRRLAPGAAEGRFVDVMSLPLAAVERVEILPDGASSIYGADAVGGVVNIILRDDAPIRESAMRVGAATEGGPAEWQASQVIGHQWEAGHGLLTFDYYGRDRLPASERARSASSDLRPFGGSNFDTLEGVPGTIIAQGSTWAVPAGQDGRSLSLSDLVKGTANLHNRNEGLDLLPSHRRGSMVGRLWHSFDDEVKFFSDFIVSERQSDFSSPPIRQTLQVPAANPFNPFGDEVQVAYSFAAELGPVIADIRTDLLHATSGIEVERQSGWQVSSYISHSSSAYELLLENLVDQTALAQALADPDPETAFNVFGDGSFSNPATRDKIRGRAHIQDRLSQWMWNIATSGNVGGMSIGLGADFRSQGFHSRIDQPGLPAITRDLNREVAATYVELLVPFVDANNRRPGVERARLSLAARHENYSDAGGVTVPKVGIEWAPHSTFTLRGNWSKSFKAPSLVDMDESSNGWLLDEQVDPQSASGRSLVLIAFGNNSGLRPETATTWTLGGDVILPGSFSASVTYFDIAHSGRTERIRYSNSFLTDPAMAELVHRNPEASFREHVCNARFTSGTRQSCLETPISALIDMRLQNVAIVRTSGVDVSAQTQWESSLGHWEATIDTTYLISFAQAQYHYLPMTDRLDTPGYPLNFRMRGSLKWRFRDFEAAAYLTFADSYTDTISAPTRRVDSWTTVDLRLGVGREKFSLALNVQNIFDEAPPFVNNPVGLGYDIENASLMGRFAAVALRASW